jgi:cholesterol transport system auxiliary component
MTIRYCLMLATSVLLGACSIIPKSEAPVVYRLPSAATQAATNAIPMRNFSLRIAAPKAATMIDSTRITVLPDGDQVTVYKGVRWSERAPVLLRNRLFDAFQAAGEVAALSLDDSNMQADIELAGTLRGFHSEYRDGHPVVVIRYDALLTSASAHRIIASRRFDVQAPADGASVAQVVRAFGQASDQLATQVVSWVLATAPQDAPHP